MELLIKRMTEAVTKAYVQKNLKVELTNGKQKERKLLTELET